MYAGKAIGGPLDGVKLTAALSWDGRVRTSDARVVDYHRGHYAWSKVRGTWCWRDTPFPEHYGKHAY